MQHQQHKLNQIKTIPVSIDHRMAEIHAIKFGGPKLRNTHRAYTKKTRSAFSDITPKQNNRLVPRLFFSRSCFRQLLYFVFNDGFCQLDFPTIFSFPLSEQTGAKSLRTLKLIPDVAFGVNYRMQVVWNTIAILRNLGGKDANHTSGPPNFEFKVHTCAWVYTYHYHYLGNCGMRRPVVLFN